VVKTVFPLALVQPKMPFALENTADVLSCISNENTGLVIE